MNKLVLTTIRQVRRLIIAVIGFTVLAIGLAMIVLPGPAFIVIPLGLGILGIEFIWARKLLDRIKSRINRKNPEQSILR
ncbi:MAG: PGPGW domain-containing protein [Thermodesulfovibrionales bacterium]|nr:PGPGW domain-containing protein [Thermodesulfovibrionales bacterium]